MNSNEKNERSVATTLVEGQWYADLKEVSGWTSAVFLKYSHCDDNDIFFSNQTEKIYAQSGEFIGFSNRHNWYEPSGEDLEIISEYMST